MSRHRCLILALCLAAAGLGACARRTTPPEDRAVRATLVHGPRWSPDQQHHFDFDLASSVAVASTPPGQYRWQGKLDVVARHRGDHVELMLLVSDVHYTAPSTAPPGPGPLTSSASAGVVVPMAERLAQPFVAALERGVVTEYRVAKVGDPEGANVLRTLASALQLAEPAAPADSWTAVEFDATGKYQAEYQRVEGGVSKRRVAYEGLILGGPSLGALSTPPKPRIDRSLAHYELHEGELKRLSAEDEIRLDAVAQGTLKSSTKLVMTRATRGDIAFMTWERIERETQPLAPGQPHVGRARSAAEFDRERIGTYTFETALAQLVLAESPPKGLAPDAKPRDLVMQQAQRAYSALGAILRTQPEMLRKALRSIESGSVAAPKLVDALADAGTPEAQATLVAVARNERLERPVRHAAVRGLVRVEGPSEATERFVRGSLDDRFYGDVCVFGVGVMARNLREGGEAERSAALADLLLARLASATTVRGRTSALHGLGNAGHAAALPRLGPYLNDPDEQVRAAAVDAVRLVLGDGADRAIAEKLRDPSRVVVLAALGAAKSRPPSDVLVQPVSELMVSSEAASVRARALEVAAVWLRDQPKLRTSLEHVATEDENSKLRAAAEKALAAAKSSG